MQRQIIVEIFPLPHYQMQAFLLFEVIIVRNKIIMEYAKVTSEIQDDVNSKKK